MLLMSGRSGDVFHKVEPIRSNCADPRAELEGGRSGFAYTGAHSLLSMSGHHGGRARQKADLSIEAGGRCSFVVDRIRQECG